MNDHDLRDLAYEPTLDGLIYKPAMDLAEVHPDLERVERILQEIRKEASRG